MSVDPMIDLRRRFRLRCGEDLAVLRAARGTPAGLASEEVSVVVHRLSGASGSFGYAALGRLARVIDEALAHGSAPCADDLERLQVALENAVDDQDS